MNAGEHKLVQLANGAYSVHSLAYGETMHPGLGPAAEAEALYVRQLRLRERLATHTGEFVIWDVGLGAGANVLTVLRTTRDLPCPLRIISFDNTLSSLAFALTHANELGYLSDYERTVRAILEEQRCEFQDGARPVKWDFYPADFPVFLSELPKGRLPSPHIILFDAFSPARNPAMWTLPLFTDLHRVLDQQISCALTTYSRSTLFRVTLLLAGFFVGRGGATGMKEETTVAANHLPLIEAPLEKIWLERVRRSQSAEPLTEAIYRQAPLSPESWEKLERHPQFTA